jgi:hypothetical protein
MRSDGTVLVSSVAAYAATQTLEWFPPGSGDYLTRFQQRGLALEADRKKRGKIEENGTILVRKGGW